MLYQQNKLQKHILNFLACFVPQAVMNLSHITGRNGSVSLIKAYIDVCRSRTSTLVFSPCLDD